MAIFAVGTLFVYFNRFEIIQMAGKSDSPTIFLDQDTRIRDYNTAATAIFPELQHAVGRLLEDVLPTVSAQVETGDGVLTVEHEMETRYYQLSASPFLSGEVQTGQLLSITDISDREQYRRRLEHQNKRLEVFAGIVCHPDLRNPLNVAEGRLDLARETGDPEHFEVAEDAHRRMEALIEDLLALARTGLEIDETEPVAIADVARTSWEMVAHNEAALVVDLDDTTVIHTDPDRLSQLFENLYRNAIEHGGLDVTITVGRLAADAGFYIEDDGYGIPEANRDELFDPGFTTQEEGTGFGLAIVAEIVNAHGWDIQVTESATGGARFEISGVTFEPN
ncbi:MAG: ATP-binding protein [Natrialbaceae archaeon]|nr:ATP-binding protein [Natrialbaceae archaeon]